MNKIEFGENSKNSKKVCFVENMLPVLNEKKRFKNMEYANDDIKVITKSAYFEYQRNKIFWRSNDNIKKIIKRREKQNNLKFKINKKIYLKPKICPHCKSKNIMPNINDEYTKTIYDLKLFNFGIKRWIIQYKSSSFTCVGCRKKFIPKQFKKVLIYNWRSYMPKNYVRHVQNGCGHNLLSWIVHQCLVSRTALRDIETNLGCYFGLGIDNRRVWEIKIKAASRYKYAYNAILRKLISGCLIHVDESKVKLKNSCGYIWVFTNMEEVYYVYKSNREAEFLDVFLKEFNGVLVSDFYAGYDSIECPKQRCLVHLIRDFNDILLKNLSDEQIKKMVSDFGKVLKDIIKTTDRYGLKKRFMKKHKVFVKRFFKTLKKTAMQSKIAEKLQNRLIKHEHELFTFLDYDNVPWNNNSVEYAIKILKDYLNLKKGSMTENGLKTHLTLLSVYQTCYYKGINFLDFLISGKKDIDDFERSLKR